MGMQREAVAETKQPEDPWCAVLCCVLCCAVCCVPWCVVCAGALSPSAVATLRAWSGTMPEPDC